MSATLEDDPTSSSSPHIGEEGQSPRNLRAPRSPLHLRPLNFFLTFVFLQEKNQYEVEMDQIDEDVLAERDFVRSGNFDESVPVVIQNLQKTCAILDFNFFTPMRKALRC